MAPDPAEEESLEACISRWPLDERWRCWPKPAPPQDRLQHRLPCSFTCQETEGRVVVAAEQQGRSSSAYHAPPTPTDPSARR